MYRKLENLLKSCQGNGDSSGDNFDQEVDKLKKENEELNRKLVLAQK